MVYIFYNIYFRPTVRVLLRLEEFDKQWDEFSSDICKKFDDFLENGSGNVLAFIPSFCIELYNYQPIRGSSWIPTPSKLVAKHAIINVKNLKDEKCIIYSILASTRATDIKRGCGSRVSSYTPFIDDLNTSGLTYPTPITEI